MTAHLPKSSSSRRTYTGDPTVGSFTIEDEIGKGSFATVYRGYQRRTKAIVAIKCVNLSKLNKKLKENLYSEIDILKGLQHPHIVALIDCQETTNHINLIMEYCELGDLSLFIKRREKLIGHAATADMARKYPNPVAGGLNEVITRHFLKQLTSALEFLRARNFIHRDVKPQNLLLLPSAQYLKTVQDGPLIMSVNEKSLIPSAGIDSLPMLKLADFGFARSLPSTSLAETLCGSPLYMAPEILRYEKYDAKADLWSVGTVLFEMVTGKPPFRASNHVELLRKIEQGNDVIRFPKDSVVSPGMKDVIRSLLKRAPVERISFENFFAHTVIKEPIPGLVGEDRPKEIKVATRSEDAEPMTRRLSSRETRQILSERDAQPAETQANSSSPRDRLSRGSPTTRGEMKLTRGTPPRPAPERIYSVNDPPRRDSQGIKRPAIIPSATAPNRQTLHDDRSPVGGAVQMARGHSRDSPSPGSSLLNEVKARNPQRHEEVSRSGERERAAQLMTENEYVMVQKEHVQVNALADEMASGVPAALQAQSLSPRSTLPVRRRTTQGNPVSTTGAVPPPASRAVQIAQGRPRADSQGHPASYGSPTSTTSAISKAIQGASLRLFGIGYAPILGRQSPPQLYSPFPAYPTTGIAGLIGERKTSGPLDDDSKAIYDIEECATRSDVVYGFAEVKFKQLMPLAPSMTHGLGGPVEKIEINSEDDGLTPDAVVALSEEALVLYVKALALLAKSMAIAGAWWSKKNRGEIITGASPARGDSIATGNRINSAVQWVRSRFNEVLEKAEIARQKLINAQKQLPEDHPGHPSNHTSTSRLAGASSTADGVVLSTGVTAERLMYDRALEMSRSAAISELANEDLAGCEISYVTAVRMLEAVLENDDEPQRNATNPADDNKADVNGITADDKQAVLKVVGMVRARLHNLRKKMAIIKKHQSIPTSSHSGGTTPTIANTPPQ